jgi:hypothetical protein
MDGRRKNDKGRWEVTEMWDRHQQIARLVTFGMSNKGIGEALGISAQQVSNVRNSPVVQRHVQVLQGKDDLETYDVMKRVTDLLPKALDVLEENLDDEDCPSSQRARTAFGLLSVGGYGQNSNVNVRGRHAILTGDDIMKLKANAVAAGFVVDEG